MSIIKGRWPKSPEKREARRRELEKATVYKRTVDRLGGFNRSRGAASRCVHVELTEAEQAELLAKYGARNSVNVASKTDA